MNESSFHKNDSIGLQDDNSRVKLCIQATDSNVPEAQMYVFKYNGGGNVEDVALLCPELPKMYLRLADPSKKKNQT